MNRFFKGTIPFCLAVFACVFMTPASGRGAEPFIYGVTEGSVYKDWVRIYWFADDSEATLTKDGASQSYGLGEQISSSGEYLIEVTATVDGVSETNSVNFFIDTSSTAVLMTNPIFTMPKITVTFHPGTYSGNPHMVVWAEDMEGNFLQNLYVGTAAATNYMRFGNGRSLVLRPQALPYWMHKTCPLTSGIYIADPETPLPDDLDAVSGATQKSGFQLTTSVTSPPPGGQVNILFEINQSFDNGWYFAPANSVAEEDNPLGITTFGQDGYFGTSNEPSLVYSVTVPLYEPGTYTTEDPAGYGHFGGRTGTLYTDFYAPYNGEERHKFDKAILMVDSLEVTVHQLPGDVNADGVLSLEDCISALKVCGGITGQAALDPESDVGTDQRIGTEEAIYVLEKVAE